MKFKLLLCFALLLSGILSGQPSSAPSRAGGKINKTLTKQIAAVLKEFQTIKPGMTRAELSKVFITEGGLSTAKHRTYVYRGCPYIKIDVDFTLANPAQNEERPTDIIAKLSKPYLDWSISD
jgi:hypothetical protein